MLSEGKREHSHSYRGSGLGKRKAYVCPERSVQDKKHSLHRRLVLVWEKACIPHYRVWTFNYRQHTIKKKKDKSRFQKDTKR